MGLLTGKTAIVTGAARGIGKAIALKFAKEGANIAFTDLVIDENAEATAKEIEGMDEQKKKDLLPIITSNYVSDSAGFAYAYSTCAPSYSDADIGSRLCLKNDALAKYCGKQFTEIWAEYLLVRK